MYLLNFIFEIYFLENNIVLFQIHKKCNEKSYFYTLLNSINGWKSLTVSLNPSYCFLGEIFSQ